MSADHSPSHSPRETDTAEVPWARTTAMRTVAATASGRKAAPAAASVAPTGPAPAPAQPPASAPAATPPVWSGKKTAIAAALAIGFSSIGYLQDMPVQIIKTDLSFSESIDRDERSCALLSSITMMGQALGLDVVVEGIERNSQLEHLREHQRRDLVRRVPRRQAEDAPAVPLGRLGGAARRGDGVRRVRVRRLS